MVTEDAADGETIRDASGLLKAGRRATKEIMDARRARYRRGGAAIEARRFLRCG